MIKQVLDRLLHVGRAFMRPRFLLVFVLPNIAFVALDAATDDATLINILNMMVMALAVGVVAAYSPAVLQTTLGNEPLDKADYLIRGILYGFWAIVVITGYTAVYRWAGMPASMRNSDLISYARFMMVIAAVCHLITPGALKESVPPKKWLKVGIIAAAGVFVALVMMRWTNADILTELPFGLGGVFDVPRP